MLKKIVILLTALALLAIPCLAAEEYHVYDGADWLTSEEEAQVAQRAEGLHAARGIDYVICIADDVGDSSASEYAYDYYYNCDCSADCLLLMIDTEGQTVGLHAYGDADDVYPQDVRDQLTDRLIESFASYSNLRIFLQYLDSAAEVEISAPQRPYWYPEDTSAFVDFHAVNPPHVVDDADLFTDEQEAEMSEKIAGIVEKTGMDLVVFTDVSSYGLPRNVYAADFYQFNGYGLDEYYSGSVLFICMEQGNRGWYTAVCGLPQGTLNSENLNMIDDRLEPYMKSGEYFDGAMGYLDDIAYTYRTGNAPEGFHWGLVGVCLLVGAVIASVVTGIMTSNMRTVNAAAEAQEYLVPGSFDLRKSYDIFLYRSVSRVKREKQSSSGGGGGSYSSSGGRSFSGSGRSF